MYQFKKGDVVVKRNGTTFTNGKFIATVTDSTDRNIVWLSTGKQIDYTSLMLLREYLENIDVSFGKLHRSFQLALFEAWLDGGVILCNGNHVVCPSWSEFTRYKLAPTKTDQQLEKEALVKEMEAIKERLANLEVD